MCGSMDVAVLSIRPLANSYAALLDVFTKGKCVSKYWIAKPGIHRL